MGWQCALPTWADTPIFVTKDRHLPDVIVRNVLSTFPIAQKVKAIACAWASNQNNMWESERRRKINKDLSLILYVKHRERYCNMWSRVLCGEIPWHPKSTSDTFSATGSCWKSRGLSTFWCILHGILGQVAPVFCYMDIGIGLLAYLFCSKIATWDDQKDWPTFRRHRKNNHLWIMRIIYRDEEIANHFPPTWRCWMG